MFFMNTLKAITSTTARTLKTFNQHVANMSSNPSSQLMETTWSFKKTWKYPIRDTRRCYFPRPKEVKRVMHNYETRMETNCGRRVLMRRILKGRHCIAH